ncbi:MAG: nitroreductase family protein [Desulfurococcaceae archaeon]|uniref:nitroreductase family protein n=1 Tax=Desulfurococcus sp. TaxID=51678 RepID=UPI0031677620
MEFLKSRRSIRKFKDQPPSLEKVLKALDIARFAPSAKNAQPWRFIVITDPEVKSKLSRIHPAAKPLERAPLAVVVACNIDESPVSYMLDCSAATVYFLLAAHALGLGTVWIQTMRNIENIREILGMPASAVPIAILAVGYPDESPEPPPRKPLESIVYLNKYGEPAIKLHDAR